MFLTSYLFSRNWSVIPQTNYVI